MKPSTRILTAAGILAAAAFSLCPPARALEPPTKEQLARYRLDGTLASRVARAKAFGNHKIPQRIQNRMERKLGRLALARSGKTPEPAAGLLAPPPAWEGMPTAGTVRVLALLISFNDYPGTTTPDYFASRLFGDGVGGPPFDSLRDFYLRSSYDRLTIEGNVLGWYQAPYARSTVAETDAGRQNLIKEALNFYEAQGHDFSQYDNDGDGAVDYFCVFWAGPHGEWAEFWWGYYTWFGDSSFRLDGKRLTNYSWQWELYNYPSGTFNPSTIIHETGHALGVPDYYDYDDAVGPDGGVGNLDIMDGTGDHNCFSKFMLDWIAPTVVPGGTRTVSLRASGLYPDALLFMPGAVGSEIFGEFFMVQNRLRSGNDTGLFTGSDGLVVWHVDARLNAWGSDFLYDNSYTDHKLLRLMEADGLEEIETFSASADAGDYYKAGASFGPLTFPDTSRYGGTPTSMLMTSVTGSTTPMGVTIVFEDAAPVVGIVDPVEGETVYGTVPVEVSASDDKGVSRVELSVDGALNGTLTAAPFVFGLDTTLLSNGSHTLRAVAYDTIGTSAAAEVSVVAENIFAPANLKAVRTLNRGLLLREYVVVLTWADNSRNTSVTKYRIYRTTGGVRTLVGETVQGVSNTTNRYLDRGVTRTGSYFYEVVGVNEDGREGLAAVATAR
jgi:M6 family metalloprotease-like protein